MHKQTHEWTNKHKQTNKKKQQQTNLTKNKQSNKERKKERNKHTHKTIQNIRFLGASAILLVSDRNVILD